MDASPDSYKYWDCSASQLTEAITTSLSFAAGGDSAWVGRMKAWFTDKTTSTISLRHLICSDTISVSSDCVSTSTFIWRHKINRGPKKKHKLFYMTSEAQEFTSIVVFHWALDCVCFSIVLFFSFASVKTARQQRNTAACLQLKALH